MDLEIPSWKLQPRKRASSWKIYRARRGRSANPGGTNPVVTVEELAEKLGFSHSSTPPTFSSCN